jgi:hypothetical protein
MQQHYHTLEKRNQGASMFAAHICHLGLDLFRNGLRAGDKVACGHITSCTATGHATDCYTLPVFKGENEVITDLNFALISTLGFLAFSC